MSIDVFVSYHKETGLETARAVVQKLEANGLRCWYQERDSGGYYASVITRMIADCGVFVVILSQEATRSKFVKSELAMAFERDRLQILPLRVSTDKLSDSATFYLSGLHWIDAVDRSLDAALEDLCARTLKGLGRSAVSVENVTSKAFGVCTEPDGMNISPVMMERYENFWTIAYTHAAAWHGFCMRYFGKAYQEMELIMNDQQWDGYSIDKKCFLRLERDMDPRMVVEYHTILSELTECGLLRLGDDTYVIPTYDVRMALRNGDYVLKYYILCTIRKRFPEAYAAMDWRISWSTTGATIGNVVDVACIRENASLLISTKFLSLKAFSSSASLNYACYKIQESGGQESGGQESGGRFGSNAKTILAAPCVPQFESGKPSRYVNHAMKRGVYLLGDECFKNDRLGAIIQNIAEGKQDWYCVEGERFPPYI